MQRLLLASRRCAVERLSLVDEDVLDSVNEYFEAENECKGLINESKASEYLEAMYKKCTEGLPLEPEEDILKVFISIFSFDSNIYPFIFFYDITDIEMKFSFSRFHLIWNHRMFVPHSC